MPEVIFNGPAGRLEGGGVRQLPVGLTGFRKILQATVDLLQPPT